MVLPVIFPFKASEECKPSGDVGQISKAQHSLPETPETTWSLLVPDVDLSRLELVREASACLAKNHISRMHVILGILLAKTGMFPNDERFHPLNFDVLGRLIGPRWVRATLSALVTGGVIQTDGTYIPKEKSRGYRLTPSSLWQQGKLVPAAPAFARWLRRHPETLRESLAPTDPAHRIIWDNMNLLEIDAAAARAMVAASSLTIRALAHRLAAVQVIASRGRKMSIGPNCGRVFSVFTNTAADLRPFLRLDGETCAEVDVAAAQPYLAAVLYPAQSLERSAYLDLVTSGRFYEFIGDAAHVVQTRKKLKIGVQVEVFFGGPECKRALWGAFASRFPELAQLLQASGGARALAIRLQRAESDVVIGRVVPRLHQELQARPFLTLHDAIFCQAGDAEHVAAVMAEEFAASIGRAPRVRITRYMGPPEEARSRAVGT